MLKKCSSLLVVAVICYGLIFGLMNEGNPGVSAFSIEAGTAVYFSAGFLFQCRTYSALSVRLDVISLFVSLFYRSFRTHQVISYSAPR
jgi:hypothetical protein